MNDSHAVAAAAPAHAAAAARRSMPLAAFLAWLAPGLGHWYLGQRVRAAVLFIVLSVTFWTGIAVGGVYSTVHPSQNGAWFGAQLCMGGESLAALIAGARIRREHAGDVRYQAFWPADNVSVVYTGICGLLNLLAIIDAIARAESPGAASAATEASGGGAPGAPP